MMMEVGIPNDDNDDNENYGSDEAIGTSNVMINDDVTIKILVIIIINMILVADNDDYIFRHQLSY